MSKKIRKNKKGKKTNCWTRKNKNLVNYIVCSGSKGQKGIYIKKTRKLKIVKKNPAPKKIKITMKNKKKITKRIKQAVLNNLKKKAVKKRKRLVLKEDIKMSPAKRGSEIDREFEEYMKKMQEVKKPRVKEIKKKMLSLEGKRSKLRSKSLKKIQNVLKAVRDYEELGIKQNDWLNDPCYVLNNVKKKMKIKKWTDAKLKRLDKTLPIMTRGSGSSNVFTYGNDEIVLNNEIGQGSFGTVFSATIKNKKTNNKKNIVLKSIITDDPVEFFSESILQMELFCKMRGQFGTGARIPKIEFISKYASARSKTGWKYIVGMEPLDGDGNKLFRDSSISDMDKIKCIKGLAELLKNLQRKFKFMHRDFHLGNMMYKNVAAPGKPKVYKMYIIDFGMSTAMIDGNFINKKTKTFHYKEKNHYNPSHDLRMTFSSMFGDSTRVNKRFDLTLSNALALSLSSILRYKCIGKDDSPLFWDTYSELIDIRDDTFLPDTVLKWCNYLIQDNRATLYSKSGINHRSGNNRVLNTGIYKKLCDLILNKKVYTITTKNTGAIKPFKFKKKYGNNEPFYSGCELKIYIQKFFLPSNVPLLGDRYDKLKERVYKDMYNK